MSDTDWHGVRGVNAELIRNINSLKIELAEARADSQRWRLVKEFHPLLRLEYWDGHGWGPLYGEAADKIVDELILNSGSTSSTKGTAETPAVGPVKPPAYKYPETFCSQCGGEFGPGNEGFSHCENHKHLPRLG